MLRRKLDPAVGLAGLLTPSTQSPVATQRRLLGIAALVVFFAALAAVVYLALVRGDRFHTPGASSVFGVSGTVLRLHLAGFGTPLPSEVDRGPCPQGRTSITIRSAAGDPIGSQIGCVLSIRKTERPDHRVGQITQTVRETYVLTGGTIVSEETQTIRFAADQRHTTAIFRGRVLRGAGRYAHARGTISGGGRGLDGRADWLINVALR